MSKKIETVVGLVVALLVIAALSGVMGKLLGLLGVTEDAVQLADAVVGLATLVAVALIWLAERKKEDRGNRKIAVVLQGPDGGRRELPLFFRAVECTRPEMLGRMGMMPMKDPGKRFTFAFFAQEDFLRALNAIQDGETSELVIPVNEAEMSQFDWDKIGT